MRVLITGGAGFLGSHFCDYFLSKGHDVMAMDNLLTGSTANIEHLAGQDGFLFQVNVVPIEIDQMVVNLKRLYLGS